MRGIAFLYPGQGSQKVGMGKSLLDHYPPARKIFQEANQILGFDLKKVCVQGPQEQLTLTQILQPALLTLSWSLTCLIKEKGIVPRVVAGHSLGEYSGILAAGVVDFPTALTIVKQRARLMQEAGENKKGGMAAVIGLEKGKVIQVCEKMGQVEVVNFNCPGQVVISGAREKIPQVSENLSHLGATRVVPLPVSGAFHSCLMRAAAKKFSTFLDQFPFAEPTCKVVSNSTGEYATSAEQVRNNLKLQMDHPVQWEKSMRLLLDDGFDFFVEVGPGKVLQGLIKRINRKVTTMGVESVESANQLISKLIS